MSDPVVGIANARSHERALFFVRETLMTRPISDKERVRKLAQELARTRYVWNHFVSSLCGGLYPKRGGGYKSGARFNGTDWEIVFEIYKIMVGEVGRIYDAARVAGVDLNAVKLDEGKIFDCITKSTGLTEYSHKPPS